ncbi:hypothetical protein KUV50_04530 [Membranicola marinus]|uniref:Methyltransferase domain-containing protein n=1 Tax=Membranihabitans marinus TaxID=1227546 RepID=A0A953HVN7_9BACT|nr:hypothetical protein [Membranihabitans marinus]MBY5957391.1 hypothetical protein [Membranihabitans marinus]
MKWWKKWWSYLLPVHLESVGSELNEALDLYLIKNRLRLTTLDAIYSFDDKYYNFHKAFEHFELPPNGAHVLILGLGLGSIPFMLEKTFQKDYHYTGVDLDDAVLYLFAKYQQERLKSPLQIIETDATLFMQSQSNRYNLICIDVFIGEIVPSHVKTNAFIRQLKNALLPGGRILWNMLYDTNEQARAVDKFIEYQFRTIFPDYQILQVLGNVILTNRAWNDEATSNHSEK